MSINISKINYNEGKYGISFDFIDGYSGLDFTTGWRTMMGDAEPKDHFVSEQEGYRVASIGGGTEGFIEEGAEFSGFPRVENLASNANVASLIAALKKAKFIDVATLAGGNDEPEEEETGTDNGGGNNNGGGTLVDDPDGD